MAIVKVSNSDNIIIEFQYDIYSENKKEENTGKQNFENNDGFIRQSLTVENIPGKRKIYYPIKIPNSNPLILDDKFKNFVFITGFDDTSLTITIKPNKYDMKEKIAISIVGHL